MGESKLVKSLRKEIEELKAEIKKAKMRQRVAVEAYSRGKVDREKVSEILRIIDKVEQGNKKKIEKKKRMIQKVWMDMVESHKKKVEKDETEKRWRHFLREVDEKEKVRGQEYRKKKRPIRERIVTRDELTRKGKYFGKLAGRMAEETRRSTEERKIRRKKVKTEQSINEKNRRTQKCSQLSGLDKLISDFESNKKCHFKENKKQNTKNTQKRQRRKNQDKQSS